MDTLSVSLSSFMQDLQTDGLDERVLIMTFSEFGRRIYQNGSAGTDHGTAAPLFIMGGGVNGGIIGDHPSLTDLDKGGNMINGIDFRSVYGTVLTDWFGLPNDDVIELLGKDYGQIPIIDSMFSTGTDQTTLPQSISLLGNYPNPFSGRTLITFDVDRADHVSLSVYDMAGRRVASLADKTLSPGSHEIGFEAKNLPAGVYLARLKTSSGTLSRKLVLVR